MKDEDLMGKDSRKDLTRHSYLTLYRLALRLAEGQPVDPVGAIVHITNACCDRCSGCEYAGVHAKACSMDRDRLLSLIGEIAALGCRSIVFSGGGEPSLHPDFAEALSCARANGLLVGALTNAAGLDAETVRHLVENASFVRVSMDASSAETFSRVRGVPAREFARRTAVIRMLVEQRESSGSRVTIGLKFLVRPDNLEEIPGFLSLARQLHVDNVQFKPIRNASAELNSQQKAHANELIRQARGEQTNIEVRGGISDTTRCEVPCSISPLRTVITAEGQVALCNYFHHRRSTHIFGNIHEKSLKDIWFSSEHKTALKCIDQEQCGLYDCRFHGLNKELLDLIENHRPQLDFI